TIPESILVIEETGARQYMLTTDEKIELFGALFTGLTNVYGTNCGQTLASQTTRKPKGDL
ncbi:MAG: hypothetical protein ACE1ZS_07630, partial [Candidatus Poribacteria bacterium]